ncbi:MAG: phospholipase D-like domain-containing protein [Pyrinomonadaceae bacterium MAG19_C2-C3]|nr:phospholipase D-like domain-containing protein [Pyrinomonadaceae bacterium MAG19_C2-C3]
MFDSTTFLVIACIAIVAQSLLLYLALFEPGLDYHVRAPQDAGLETPKFLYALEALTDSKAHLCECRIEVLTNGENYYEAELAAIAEAKESINLEAYIFRRGRIGERFLEALTERARAGVRVNLVIDAIGSFTSWESFFKDLRAAGGRVAWYHPFDMHTLPRINNRTHRELIIIDGRTGFIGGAGFADHWRYPPNDKQPRWRDTMCYVEGSVVAGMQATFAENWLETSGEILSANYFPCEDEESKDDCPLIEGIEGKTDDDVTDDTKRIDAKGSIAVSNDATSEVATSKPVTPQLATLNPSALKRAAVNDDDDIAALVINSSPSMGRSTRARILYGMILAGACESICITTPYFLPDDGARDELIRAIKERDVKVKIIVPGDNIDHAIVRSSSRRLYGDLLRAGAEIHEYQPGMIHTKSLIVDGFWSVVGSTNLDNRSFGLNDEVNLAVRNRRLASRLNEDFERDLADSRQVNYEEWRNRSYRERVIEQVGRLLQRQQ